MVVVPACFLFRANEAWIPHSLHPGKKTDLPGNPGLGCSRGWGNFSGGEVNDRRHRPLSRSQTVDKRHNPKIGLGACPGLLLSFPQ